MLSQTIKSEINKLWNKFWSGGISNPLTAIEQISYLLFMRRLDELDLREIKKAEFSGEKYDSLFKGSFQVPNTSETVDKSTCAGATSNRWRAELCLLMFRLRFFRLLNSLTVKEQLLEDTCVMLSLLFPNLPCWLNQ